jgi:hypothetical protein
MLPKKINKEMRLWLRGKTIERVKVVRPTEEERDMYEHVLGPMALRMTFTDGSSIILDSWVGSYKLKPSALSGVQNLRARSYLTISRKEVATK